jgi:hypothetical protein
MTSPSRSPHAAALLGQSACLFLLLCVWLGPNLTLSLLILIAIGWSLFAACRRWPLVGVFLLGFLRGLIGR